MKLLSELTGTQLHTFSINSSIDTTELLGGFEQIDLNRHKKEIVENVKEHVEYLSQLLLLKDTKELLNIQQLWQLFKSSNKFSEIQKEGEYVFFSYHRISLISLFLRMQAFSDDQFHLLLKLIVKLKDITSSLGNLPPCFFFFFSSVFPSYCFFFFFVSRARN